jgi:mRNA-degrading endonuclease RelE of RelBE toxin-antitoxin system
VEQESAKENLAFSVFKVFWHPEVKKDLSRITPAVVEAIVRSANERLSRAPQLIGEPLKGTTNRLWKFRFSRYRIVYTILDRRKEVWILSVQKRDIVYRDRHVQELLRLAVALLEEGS